MLSKGSCCCVMSPFCHTRGWLVQIHFIGYPRLSRYNSSLPQVLTFVPESRGKFHQLPLPTVVEVILCTDIYAYKSYIKNHVVFFLSKIRKRSIIKCNNPWHWFSSKIQCEHFFLSSDKSLAMLWKNICRLLTLCIWMTSEAFINVLMHSKHLKKKLQLLPRWKLATQITENLVHDSLCMCVYFFRKDGCFGNAFILNDFLDRVYWDIFIHSISKHVLKSI